MVKGAKKSDSKEEIVTVTKTVVKKAPRKITRTRKKRATPKQPQRTKREEKNIEKILIENFISMQKVMTNMAEKFDHLTKQISSLLDLFDESAKALTEKEIKLQLEGGKKEQEIIDRLNMVLDQNKLIAKGLTLMHETAVTPGSYYSLAPTQESRPMQPQRPMIQKPLPQASQQSPMLQPSMREQEEEFDITTPTKKPGVMEEDQNPTFSFGQNA